jgi:hypothetical protein
VKAKLKISKKLLIRLAIFAALITSAFLIDSYLDHNPVHLKQAQSTNDLPSHNQGAFVLYNPVNSLNARSFTPKAPTRLLQTRLHDKLLQKHYQMRNLHIFKTDFRNQKIPVVLSYHYIILRDYYSDVPDDDPPLV